MNVIANYVTNLAEVELENSIIEYKIKAREVDMEHRQDLTRRRDIDNARRFIDEKAEQLKAIGELATIIAFFSVSALCEINIPTETNEIILFIFGLLAVLTVLILIVSLC
jgi:hypothetical protein